MSLVFKLGDVVYGATFGKGVVEKVDGSEIPYYVSHIGGYSWTPEQFLSFTPWPKPNHVRPLPEGLHIIKYDGNEYLAVWNGDRWRWALGEAPRWDGGLIICAEKVQSVKFLSELPKN